MRRCPSETCCATKVAGGSKSTLEPNCSGKPTSPGDPLCKNFFSAENPADSTSGTGKSAPADALAGKTAIGEQESVVPDRVHLHRIPKLRQGRSTLTNEFTRGGYRARFRFIARYPPHSAASDLAERITRHDPAVSRHQGLVILNPPLGAAGFSWPHARIALIIKLRRCCCSCYVHSRYDRFCFKPSVRNVDRRLVGFQKSPPVL
jgi:hypothetical protein